MLTDAALTVGLDRQDDSGFTEDELHVKVHLAPASTSVAVFFARTQ